MNGLIALVGSGEYLPVMEDIDRHLLASVNVKTPRVVCIPTAAGQEGDESVNRWLRMGVEHFKRLGADVQALHIIDQQSANDAQHEALLENADLIYFSGGNPQYLFETMHGSRAWAAMQKAWNSGAVYAGCSAGAMILSERIPSFRLARDARRLRHSARQIHHSAFRCYSTPLETVGVCAEKSAQKRPAHAWSGREYCSGGAAQW